MTTSPYTLHIPADAAPGDPGALDRADLVRDGFAWGAIVSPSLWFFWHRHWLLGIAAFLVGAALVLGLWAAGAGAGTIVVADILLHVLFGLEGSSLRRFAYARRGRPVADVVLASDPAEAETKTFARWLQPAAAVEQPRFATAPALSPGYRSLSEPVIGLFPDIEGRRT